MREHSNILAKNYKLLIPIIIIVINNHVSYAQDISNDDHYVNVNIPEVAMVDIEGDPSVVINPSAPNEAGMSLDLEDDNENSLWLNYSSVIGSVTESSRDITAHIGSGSVPGGTQLELVAAEYEGEGDGTLGTPTPGIILNYEEQNIVTGIGSCYTGNGINNGHRLNYTLVLVDEDYSDLEGDSNSLQVIYTITNN